MLTKEPEMLQTCAFCFCEDTMQHAAKIRLRSPRRCWGSLQCSPVPWFYGVTSRRWGEEWM